jgi:hypothetical protein
LNFTFLVKHKNPDWRAVLERAIAQLRSLAEAGDVMVRLSDILRSLDQNAKLWPMLDDIATQVPIVVNGERVYGSDEDWKDLLTAAFEQDIRMAVGLTGGMVMLGARTREYGKAKFSDFIEFIYATGADRNVVWSEKAEEHFAQYRPRARA